MLQNNYDNLDFERLKTNFNLNMINLASLQTDFITSLPKELNKISLLTDKISNLNIISGNCYLYKKGSDLELISSDNVIFDKVFNTFKLKPTLSYSIEVREGLSKLITNKEVRIYDKDKTRLKNIDDLLVRGETLNIHTKENNYTYTLSLNFSGMTTVNNLVLRLNEETLSYPNISEIYFINTRKEKVPVKLLNNNAYNLDIDIYKNSDNVYSLDLETFSADNVNIVLEDSLSDLIIDELSTNYMEFDTEGEIILEGIRGEKPVLKVGLEAEGDVANVDFFISYNQTDWLPIDLSNIYGLEKDNKVLSFNTIAEDSIKNDIDIKNIFLKLKIKAKKSFYKPDSKINRDIFRNSSINVSNIDFDEFSLYENSSSVYYGKISTSNLFNFLDFYESGEYLLVNNKYYIKGFVESSVSKSKESPYTYSPVSVKNKEVRKTGESLRFSDIDISTKELYSFKINEIDKNLLDSNKVDYVLPLKDSTVRSEYFISQEDTQIEINLNLGFINSAIDVLFAVDPSKPVYLLDGFKNFLIELPIFELQPASLESEAGVSAVSLLDAGLFKDLENLSRSYPIKPLKDYEVGLLDNKLISINKDRQVKAFNITKEKLYTDDKVSSTNINYSKLISTDDYNKSILKGKEEVGSRERQIKLINNSIIKGSVKIKEKL